MKIEYYRLHLKTQAYCIVHIHLIINVAIVVEMIPPYHLWVDVDIDILYGRYVWKQRKVHKRLVILHRVAKVEQGRNMSSQQGCMPITTYPLDLSDEIPWESGFQQTTLESCRAHYDKLQNDLSSLDLALQNKQSIDMVLLSLQKFIEVYEDLGPTTNGFVALMQRRKAEVMGPDKWAVVKERVTKDQANSMFNFKEGLKRKALKVQYFKHPELAHFLYDRFLIVYGRFPWNDEVPNYFARFFYVDFFKI